VQPALGPPQPQQDGRDQHQRVIRGRTRQSHPRRPARMPPFHTRSYGALAHPISEPFMISERMGITTMPQGSRCMCGTGLSDTCPPANAVSSPPILAASACAASWHVWKKETQRTR